MRLRRERSQERHPNEAESIFRGRSAGLIQDDFQGGSGSKQ